jgi:hypothetical protein
MQKHIYILLILHTLSFFTLNGNDTINIKPEYHYLPSMYIDGELVPVINLSDIYIVGKRKFKSRFDARKYERLVRNIKITLPYARLAKKKYDEMVAVYSNLQNKRDKKEYVNNIEKEIMKEFGPELEQLSITQGKILIKLLDREIGSTSYDLLKEFKGAFSAAFWQTLSRIFGYNLKTHYDPKGEDKIIEDIIYLIDLGLI